MPLGVPAWSPSAPPDSAPALRAAPAAMRLPGAEHGGAVRWSLLGMIAAVEMWDIDAPGECGRRYAAAARPHGALRMLQISAHANATSEVLRGNLTTAAAHFAEFKDFADATGADARFSHPTDAMLHGWRGDEPAILAAAHATQDPYPELPGGVPAQLELTGVPDCLVTGCRSELPAVLRGSVSQLP
ncbi:hypothetical protein ACFU5O_30555 [Streptomyces sp. NPDC057445]|uniref:hypothetical protein n=1 Tax=Streptomyces sp. NPDC057445 TaxID=3346136 RepID=UPI0036C50DAA